MSIPYNPETHYLVKGKYMTADGIEHEYNTVKKRKANSRTKGRPEKLPDTNTDKLKELRELGLSCKKIGSTLGISAYHAKKIYSEISGEPESDDSGSDA